jgi:hypothetical protein
MLLPPNQAQESEISSEERDRLLDRAAREVVRRRLETPVILAIEINRPLGFFGHQGMVFLQPMLAPVVGWQRLDRVIQLLADPKNVDRFFDHLEQAVRERDNAPRPTEVPAHE